MASCTKCLLCKQEDLSVIVQNSHEKLGRFCYLSTGEEEAGGFLGLNSWTNEVRIQQKTPSQKLKRWHVFSHI